MLKPSVAADAVVWKVPQCPISIECSPAVLDEIQRSVVEAFYSVPRGGVEVGGILFGKHEKDRVSILVQQRLDCEHARGPSFTLSEKDQASLRQRLEGAREDRDLKGLQPVGWYHSHTRTDISLSETDLSVYDSYFPEIWQVSLIVRPDHTRPTRAGFFFREPGGKVRTESSYQEFTLQPADQFSPAHNRSREQRKWEREEEPAVTPKREAAVVTAPEPIPELSQPVIQRAVRSAPHAPDSAVPVQLPAFLVPPSGRRSLKRVWLAAALVLVLGGAGFGARRYWFPEPVQSLNLRAVDQEGQLFFRWNRNANSIASASRGTLEILDGNITASLPMDSVQLQAGSFSYARQTGQVRARLVVKRADGKTVEDSTSFLGQIPPQQAAARLERQRDELARESQRMKTDLLNQTYRTRRLERTIQRLQRRLSDERR